jgi:hypothetical protein
MPLPNVTLGVVPRCQAKSKRSGKRCWNLCAHGSVKVCRMHGARPKETTLRGEQHPNFKHGKATGEKRKQNAVSATRLLLLRDLGLRIGLFGSKPTGWVGRPPTLYNYATKISIEALIGQIELLDNEVLLTKESE